MSYQAAPIGKFQPLRLLFSYLIAAAAQTIVLMIYTPTPPVNGDYAALANTLAFFWMTPLTVIALLPRSFNVYLLCSAIISLAVILWLLRPVSGRTAARRVFTILALLIAAALSWFFNGYLLSSAVIFAAAFIWTLRHPFPKNISAPRIRAIALLLLVAAAAVAAWNMQRDNDCSIPGIASGTQENLPMSHGTKLFCIRDFGAGRWDFTSTSHRSYNCKSVTGKPGNLLDVDQYSLWIPPTVCRVYDY